MLQVEIGIRMALGATERGVTGMVLKSAMVLVSAGLLLGIPLAFWSRRFVASLVANLGGTLSVPVACAVGAMIVVGLVAAYLPARRTARVHPVGALRHS